MPTHALLVLLHFCWATMVASTPAQLEATLIRVSVCHATQPVRSVVDHSILNARSVLVDSYYHWLHVWISVDLGTTRTQSTQSVISVIVHAVSVVTWRCVHRVWHQVCSRAQFVKQIVQLATTISKELVQYVLMAVLRVHQLQCVVHAWMDISYHLADVLLDVWMESSWVQVSVSTVTVLAVPVRH